MGDTERDRLVLLCLSLNCGLCARLMTCVCWCVCANVAQLWHVENNKVGWGGLRRVGGKTGAKGGRAEDKRKLRNAAVSWPRDTESPRLSADCGITPCHTHILTRG